MYDNLPARKSKYIVLTYELILPLLIILAVVTGGYLALRSSLFSLQEIKCSLDYEPCPEGPVTAELAKYRGFNLLRLKTDGLRSRLTAGDFTIREALFKKKLPRTLIVELQSVYPVAATQVKGVKDEWLVYDRLHRVIALRKTDPNVPTVILQSSPILRVGEEVRDPQIVQALDLSVAVSAELTGISSTSLDGDTFSIQLDNGKTALLSTAKDRQLQIRTLQAILAADTMGSEVRIIDVRFSKPVLKSN